MFITQDTLTELDVLGLLAEHLTQMGLSILDPKAPTRVLGIEALRHPSVTCYTSWEDDVQGGGRSLTGIAALKQMDERSGEVKSMRTSSNHLRKGVAAALLRHVIAEARSRKYSDLYFETGSSNAFTPARKLYKSFGANECGPYADYEANPFSVFLVLKLK